MGDDKKLVSREEEQTRVEGCETLLRHLVQIAMGLARVPRAGDVYMQRILNCAIGWLNDESGLRGIRDAFLELYADLHSSTDSRKPYEKFMNAVLHDPAAEVRAPLEFATYYLSAACSDTEMDLTTRFELLDAILWDSVIPNTQDSVRTHCDDFRSLVEAASHDLEDGFEIADMRLDELLREGRNLLAVIRELASS